MGGIKLDTNIILDILIFFKDYLIFINIFFALVIIFLERKRPEYTLFWVMLLLLTSYFGFIMYLFFGLSFKKKSVLKKYYEKNEITKHKRYNRKILKEMEKWKNIHNYLANTSLSKLTSNNHFMLFNSGESFFKSLVENIKNAKSSIYMEYYIFDDDQIGKPIYDLLIKKAKEGVKIKIIIDGVGSKRVKKSRIRELRANGIEIQVFFPSYLPFSEIGNLRANYRNHRKMTIIDNKMCYSGGINIGEDYVGKGRLGEWQDIGFALRGESVVEYLHNFEVSWKFLKKDTNDDYTSISVDVKEYPTNFIQVIGSGPNYDFERIRDINLYLINNARKNIVIQTPYFVPDDTVLNALKRALLSGVNVIINVPKVGDHAFVYWANQYFLGQLLKLGAKVYKYNGGFIHSKLVMVDGEIVFTGTANFDYRSMYQNFEINILMFGDKVDSFKERIKKDIKNSTQYTLEQHQKRKNIEKIKESISKLISPLL